ALEILATVQTRAQNEVAIQQRAGFAEQEKQIFAHLGSVRRWRAVLKAWPLLRIRCSGGRPKTLAMQLAIEEQSAGLDSVEEPFDGSSKGARQRRALSIRRAILPRCIICGLVGLGCGS